MFVLRENREQVVGILAAALACGFDAVRVGLVLVQPVQGDAAVARTDLSAATPTAQAGNSPQPSAGEVLEFGATACSV